MVVADRSDSNSEIQRRQDGYYQFINMAFILKVIRNLYAIPPSLLVSSFSLYHFLISVSSVSPCDLLCNFVNKIHSLENYFVVRKQIAKDIVFRVKSFSHTFRRIKRFFRNME